MGVICKGKVGGGGDNWVIKLFNSTNTLGVGGGSELFLKMVIVALILNDVIFFNPKQWQGGGDIISSVPPHPN